MSASIAINKITLKVEIESEFLRRIPVADPGFPRGGGANPKGGANLLFGQFFLKTARK